GPPNSTRTSIANDPNAAKMDVCGWSITLSASAKTAGMTIAARAALFSAARSGTARDDTSAQLRARTSIVGPTQYYTASALDGFIADVDNSLDWLFTRAREPDGPLNYGE